MEYDKELVALISQALRAIERDLSLPCKSLVDETPLPKIRDGVRLKTMEVQLDQNVMASVRQPHQAFQGAKTPQKGR